MNEKDIKHLLHCWYIDKWIYIVSQEYCHSELSPTSGMSVFSDLTLKYLWFLLSWPDEVSTTYDLGILAACLTVFGTCCSCVKTQTGISSRSSGSSWTLLHWSNWCFCSFLTSCPSSWTHLYLASLVSNIFLSRVRWYRVYVSSVT